MSNQAGQGTSGRRRRREGRREGGKAYLVLDIFINKIHRLLDEEISVRGELTLAQQLDEGCRAVGGAAVGWRREDGREGGREGKRANKVCGGIWRKLPTLSNVSSLPSSLPPFLLTCNDTPNANHLRGLRAAGTTLLLQRVRDALVEIYVK